MQLPFWALIKRGTMGTYGKKHGQHSKESEIKNLLI